MGIEKAWRATIAVGFWRLMGPCEVAGGSLRRLKALDAKNPSPIAIVTVGFLTHGGPIVVAKIIASFASVLARVLAFVPVLVRVRG